MALTRSGAALVFGPASAGAGAQGFGVISKTTQKKYSSEKELIGGDGEIVDVVYTGAEETEVKTEYVTSNSIPATALGTGNFFGTGVTTRVSLQMTNEDMCKLETETIKSI
jgi:hypothetical protein